MRLLVSYFAMRRSRQKYMYDRRWEALMPQHRVQKWRKMTFYSREDSTCCIYSYIMYVRQLHPKSQAVFASLLLSTLPPYSHAFTITYLSGHASVNLDWTQFNPHPYVGCPAIRVNQGSLINACSVDAHNPDSIWIQPGFNLGSSASADKPCNYFIDTPSAYTKDDVKAYKSLDAYKYPLAGWVVAIIKYAGNFSTLAWMYFKAMLYTTCDIPMNGRPSPDKLPTALGDKTLFGFWDEHFTLWRRTIYCWRRTRTAGA